MSSKIYAISDIHGCYDSFIQALQLIDLSGNNKLVLLGDYIHRGHEPYKVLDKVMELEDMHGKDKVICLMGNHENMVLQGYQSISEKSLHNGIGNGIDDEKYLGWMRGLRLYYKTEIQIFTHAGIDEEALDYWEWGTSEFVFLEKYPHKIGKFYMDVISGHISTSEIANDPRFCDIYYDGYSHYYIDGSVEKNGKLLVLMYDTSNRKYYRVTENGINLILAYDERRVSDG